MCAGNSCSPAGEQASGEASLLGLVLCSLLQLSFSKCEVMLTLSCRCFEVSVQYLIGGFFGGFVAEGHYILHYFLFTFHIPVPSRAPLLSSTPTGKLPLPELFVQQKLVGCSLLLT